MANSTEEVTTQIEDGEYWVQFATPVRVTVSVTDGEVEVTEVVNELEGTYLLQDGDVFPINKWGQPIDETQAEVLREAADADGVVWPARDNG